MYILEGKTKHLRIKFCLIKVKNKKENEKSLQINEKCDNKLIRRATATALQQSRKETKKV